MSMRNIRKLYGGNELPAPEGNSDEEYEPLYAKASPSKFKYEGFILSSHSESEHESTDAVATEKAQDKRSKKKKTKKQHKPKLKVQTDATKNIELDEIDKSLMEVNAMCAPPPAPTASVSTEKTSTAPQLMAVQAKHLNPSNEMKKLFGPEEPGTRRRGRQPNKNRLLKRAVIVPITDSTHFQKSGLSMSMYRRDNGVTYFVFDHSREYQKIHSAFLNMLRLRERYNNDNLAISIEEAQKNMHVEAMLESADALFRFEAYSAANALIEQTIAYMQCVAHPSFTLTDPNIRLEYSIPENRPFHIAVLKYMYLLTNRACHRTALELAKLLLNLDQSDPLAVLLVVDTLALRAREHQWLIDAAELWANERDAGLLFNIQYSTAMAHYHVANKDKGAEMSKADELLQAAMLSFPGVVYKLLQSANVPPTATMKDCALFAKADNTTGKNLRDLMTLYAKLTWSKWREPGVFEWFTRNADTLAGKYRDDTHTQERAKELANEQLNLFQGWPEQIVRHLSIIKPMSNFLVDGAVPRVNRSRSFDPVPPTPGASRYGYGRPGAASAQLPAMELPRQIAEYVGRNAEEIVQALLGDRNNLLDVAEGLDLGTDDEEDEADPQGAPGLVMSVESLSNALRHFMGVVEGSNDAPAPVEDPPRPDNDDHPHAD